MSLANGRPLRAIPGPSIIPDRVLNAMHRAAPNIYAGELLDLTTRIKADLSDVACTEGESLIYIGNGHAGWEAALSNIVNPGDKVLALETGRFTKGWVEMARKMGIEVDCLDFGTAATLDLDRVESTLRADTSQQIRAILLVQVDTASSVRNDIKALREIIDATGHPALLCVDCIASLGCERYRMDDWGVDLTVSACQKGLMTPPGLAFNHIGDRAWEARKRATHTTGYWDWELRRDPEIFYMNFNGTAPTHHIYGLAEALDMILREQGLAATWSRHAALAEAIWAAVEHWGTDGPLACNITDRALRAHSVTTIRTGDADADALRNWCEENAGLTLGIGLGLDGARSGYPDGIFRIGHMGHLNPPMVLGTLATIEAGLKALGIPHGQGALSAAAEVIATRA